MLLVASKFFLSSELVNQTDLLLVGTPRLGWIDSTAGRPALKLLNFSRVEVLLRAFKLLSQSFW
jgi:hypothetical protein